MSVSGFKINNTIERYSYPDLDNISVEYGDLSPGVKEVIINKVTRDSLNDAGIHNRTYVTEVDTTSVTTVSTDLHPSYYAVVEEERGDKLVRGKMYRITFDGVEYYVPAFRWFWDGSDGTTFWSKGVTFIGNLSLFCDASGFYATLPDVPFVITNIYSLIPLVNEKIFLFAETAGQHSIKIERIDYDLTRVPNRLVWGNEISPIYEKIGDGGTNYTGICVGLNDMKNRKSTVAVGFNNIMSGQAGSILGHNCLVTAQAGIAVGNRNESHAAGASAFGYLTKASGNFAESHGYDSTSSGTMSTTHGFRTIANHKSQFAFGEYNLADDSSATASDRGNYVEIVGNGTSRDNRSNARTLDWNGNESLAGGITLGKGTADEVTLTAAQLKSLLALLS